MARSVLSRGARGSPTARRRMWGSGMSFIGPQPKDFRFRIANGAPSNGFEVFNSLHFLRGRKINPLPWCGSRPFLRSDFSAMEAPPPWERGRFAARGPRYPRRSSV